MNILLDAQLYQEFSPLNTSSVNETQLLTVQNVSTTNVSDSPVKSDLFFNFTFYLIYIVIFVVGVVGNLLICFIVWRKGAMRTATNLSITNLALADLLLCCLCVPFTPLYRYMEQWVFGRFLCKGVAFFQGASVYISSFTLTFIAINRFFLIVYPIRTRIVTKHFYAGYAIIWCTAGVLTAPYGIFVDIEEYPDHSGTYCEEHWPSPLIRRSFSVTTALLQFFIPLLVISYCYWRISKRLDQRMKYFMMKDHSRIASVDAKKLRRAEEVARRRRTNRMLILMVCMFGLTWLPLNAVNLLLDFYPSANQWKYMTAAFVVSHAWAMSSICYNPLIYAWLNENFRNEFIALFRTINYTIQKLLMLNKRPSDDGSRDTQFDSVVLMNSSGVLLVTKRDKQCIEVTMDNMTTTWERPTEYILD